VHWGSPLTAEPSKHSAYGFTSGACEASFKLSANAAVDLKEHGCFLVRYHFLELRVFQPQLSSILIEGGQRLMKLSACSPVTVS